ncbi:uncharacterized protein CANTADRAFT_24155 [Suhomyces tanzawaensis NRRL Y-17324]|uniref:P/Homo B domain-containing protein n=1 Tax=Suhomyces tanzawaensis NRRL Y-17324 TaxID=984487 RepID=A0A1E4SBQ3_9ASCO|nr:uncharacterized protein CANTADRAFT_24155 [Suhomyces tanzawaensis NRRL Y-17324]ODV76896.1 hypothetical protein CANTADRAFT_24155 [Suhomyces tanzawaensis NRRL Y-17324]
MLLIKKVASALGLLLALTNASVAPPRDYAGRNYFLVELNTQDSNRPLSDFISAHDEYRFENQLHGLDNHYVFSIDKLHPHNEFLGNHNSNGHSLIKRAAGFEDAYDALMENGHLKSIHLLPPKQLKKRLPVLITEEPEQHTPPQKRLEMVDSSQAELKKVSDQLDIQDPLFAEQWHLVNTHYPGNDVNVSGLWFEGITGKGIVTAIVDDGLDFENPDLTENFNAKGSWDYNNQGPAPLPRLFDDYHGTRCAGEIAAVKNDVCGVGVAYNSQVSGIRILSGAITGAEEAQALVYGLGINDIYSCSWGPTDDGRTLSEPEAIVKKAFIKGVQAGREDKGSVYVFASGNGGRSSDSCNFDGYTNSIYSITVGAIDYKGLHPTYAEACSAVMVVTYSSGSGEHIHTTDIHKKCSATHGGTSAAAPLAAGIYSLILLKNPNLTWRDVQYVSVLSSTPVNEDDGHYQTTALKRKYSHKYGYGKMDAYTMAHFAENWKNVKPQAWYYSDVMPVSESLKVGSGPQIISKSILITQADLDAMNLERIEHVTVKVNIKSTFRGRVGVRLVSPYGVHSDLATFRPGDVSGMGFKNWTFMSVAHWGEPGVGEWSLEVFGDKNGPLDTEITFEDWQLRFFGESIDADKAETYDLDVDYAAVRRDRMKQEPEPTTSIESSSSSVPEQTNESSATEQVSTTEASSSTDTTTTTSEPEDKTKTSTTAKPEDKNKATETGTSTKTSEDAAETEDPEDADFPEEEEPEGEEGYNKQLSSGHTGQYFIGVAIVGFVVVLLLMKFHKSPGSGRRTRRREDYEFDIIPGEDYTDSEDEGDDDSFDLGRGGRSHRNNRSDEPNYPDGSDGLPVYEEEMFRIDDEDEAPVDKKPQKKHEGNKYQQLEQEIPDAENDDGDDRLGSSSV